MPVDLGKEMAAQLGIPVEYVAYDNSGQITDVAAKGVWDVTFLPQDAVRMTKMSSGFCKLQNTSHWPSGEGSANQWIGAEEYVRRILFACSIQKSSS